MAYFLAKSEPADYSLDDLERDKTTTWDGVRNAQAVHTIQSMQPGDDLLIYHSGGNPAIVGLARITSQPRPDAKDDKSWVVDVAFVRRLSRPVSLHEIKASHLFDDWLLVRQGRLSTMSVPDAFVEWLKKQKVL